MIVLDTVTLPEEMHWMDEFEWSDVKASTKLTLHGKMIVENSTVLGSKGRPITLGGDSAWIKREDLLYLMEWAQVPNKQMGLTINDGRVFIVGFRLWEPPVIVTEPLTGTNHPDAETLYKLTELRLALV